MLTAEVMMWGAILTAVSVVNLGSSEQCLDSRDPSKVYDLRPYERLEMQLSVIFPLGTGYPVTWRVYGTIDDFSGAERWDTEPLLSGVIQPADPGMATIRLDGISRFRVCVTGDDNFVVPLVDAEYRRAAPWGH